MTDNPRVPDHGAHPSPAAQDGAAGSDVNLEDAFRLFNRLSQQLSGSYQALETRVHQLNAELTAARDGQAQQLAQTRRIANRLQSLLEALPGGVVVLDGQGRIEECNPAARELLGEPLLEQRWSCVIERAFDPGGADGHEVRLRDGRLVSVVTSSLSPEPGQILLINDLTQTRALQERLSRHRRLAAMGEMVARLAHQIRTPLASAMLYCSHLSRPLLGEADRLRVAEKIQSSVRHLESVINDMLVFAKGGSSGNDIVDVKALVEAMEPVMTPLLEKHGCRFSIVNEFESARVRGNSDALLGCLQNLCDNAIQACGDGAELVLRVRAAEPRAVDLVLSDNGPGIAREQQERIFEPFYTTKSQGTGLGLAVVQAVVQAHQGMVWVESQPGRGTSIGLRLPLYLGTAAPAAEPAVVQRDGFADQERKHA